MHQKKKKSSYTNPGPIPTYPIDTTQYQISAAKDTHKKQLELFKKKLFV